MNTMTLLSLIPWVLTIIVGVWIYMNKFKNCTYEVVAEVVCINEKRGSGSHAGRMMVYQPVFAYEWHGWTRQLSPRAWDSDMKYEVGDKVVLLIDPEHPENFRYKDTARDPMLKIVFIAIMAVLMLAAAMLRIR